MVSIICFRVSSIYETFLRFTKVLLVKLKINCIGLDGGKIRRILDELKKWISQKETGNHLHDID